MDRAHLRGLIALVGVAGLAGACGRPSARILCHNANCSGASAPYLDDTIQALKQSLALRWNRAPLLDGVEIDLVWDTTEQRCVFAHDHTAVGVDSVEAIGEIANHLLDTASEVGRRRFTVKLEGKSRVRGTSLAHTDTELAAHAVCMLDAYEVLAVAAEASGRRLTVLFESESPALVVAVKDDDRFPRALPEGVEVGFMIPFALTPPPGLEISAIAIHWKQVHDGYAAEVRDLQARGIDVVMWMYDGGIEALDTIDHVRPRYVNTNEAMLLREWLGPSPEGDE